MILLDSNVLVYAVYKKAPLHEISARLVKEGFRKRGHFCISPQNILEFCAVVTRSSLVDPPLPAGEVMRIAHLLFTSRCLMKIYPKRATVMRAIREGSRINLSGPRWHDMFLGTTMADAGVKEIINENVRDFVVFPWLTVQKLSDIK